MKQLRSLAYPLVTLAIFAGCGTPKDQAETPQDSTTAVAEPVNDTRLFNIDSIKQEIDNAIQFQRQHLRLNRDKLKGYLKTLNPTDATSIPLAVHFIEEYPEAPGASVYDTLYSQFVSLYYEASVPFTDLINTERYALLMNKLYDKPDDAALKNLTRYLDLYSISVGSSEGMYEAEPDPDFFFHVFSNKASPALHDFLVIRKKEMAEGYAEDAGLMISFQQVYERVEAWGKFMKDHPGHALGQEALLYYTSYMQTLLVGMDNTPAFEDGTLTAEVKKIYETVRQQGQDSVSRQIINDYYEYLSKASFKMSDKNYDFIQQYDLEKAFDVHHADLNP